MTNVEIYTSANDDLDPNRKCKDRASISQALATDLGLERQDHIRVDNGPYSTYYRVNSIHENPSKPILVHENHIDRFGVSPGSRVDVSTAIPRETPAEAKESGGLAEVLKDDGVQDSVLVTAPHGGAAEKGTHQMAERCYERLRQEGVPVSLWMLLGYKSPAQELSSFRTWRVGSPIRGQNGYPGLMEIVDRDFDLVIGFHRSGYEYIEVGGRIEKSVRDSVAEKLRERTGKSVKTVLSELCNPGTHRKVSVNYLSEDDGGLHIECTPDTCNTYQKAVSLSVVEVVMDYLRSARESQPCCE